MAAVADAFAAVAECSAVESAVAGSCCADYIGYRHIDRNFVAFDSEAFFVGGSFPDSAEPRTATRTGVVGPSGQHCGLERSLDSAFLSQAPY